MNIEVSRVDVAVIVPLREIYRQEMNCQIVHDSFPGRGFSDPYVIRVEGEIAGYGLVANRHYPDAVHEFMTLRAHRGAALRMFRQLLEFSSAGKIRAQSNDRLMLGMLHDCATNITADAVLFTDAATTHLPCPGGTLSPVTEADHAGLFTHRHEPVGDWMIERDGVAVATGGALFHYNPPYGDIYMEVHEAYRLRGYGSYLVQELKRICYEEGKIPAARCGISNTASRLTLEKAGLLPCGHLLMGDLVR